MKLEDFLIHKPFGTYLQCRACGITGWDNLHQHNGGCPAPDWITQSNGTGAEGFPYVAAVWQDLRKAIGELAMACGNPAVEFRNPEQSVEGQTIREAARRLRDPQIIKPVYVEPAKIKDITEEGVRLLRDAQVDGAESVYFTAAKQMRQLCDLALKGMLNADKGLTFKQLRAANIARIPLFKNSKGGLAHGEKDGSDWSPAQWLQAVIGELGEYANIRKKFERGDLSFEEYAVKASMELADVMTYLDILALRALDRTSSVALAELVGGDDASGSANTPHPQGIDLGEAVRTKFNIISERVGCNVRL